MNPADTYVSAARLKVRDIIRHDIPHIMIDGDRFSRAYNWMMTNLHDSEFWSKRVEARDDAFATFCRLYVLHQAKDEEELRGAARMFDRVNEIFMHRSLRKANEEFELKMERDGWVRGKVVNGIQHYHCKDGRAFQLRESPKPGPVNKRRKKS